MLTINVLDDPHYRRRELIQGTEYVIELNYRTRQQGWFMSIFDTDETPIRQGMRLTPGWNPLLRAKSELLPDGEFYVSSTKDPMGRDAFKDGDARLVHFSAAEVAEFDVTAAATQDTILFE
jgi:hypothetical protein